jgi:hypothetical protein
LESTPPICSFSNPCSVPLSKFIMICLLASFLKSVSKIRMQALLEHWLYLSCSPLCIPSTGMSAKTGKLNYAYLLNEQTNNLRQM